MATRLTLRPAHEFDLGFLAELFNRGFEGYFVPVAETPEGLAARLCHDTIDLAASRVAFLGGRPVGVVYLAVRGWDCRIAGMGVVAGARRRGVGRRLMEAVIARARALGLRAMVLEVIERNAPAVALYRGLGFAPARRLVGYELDAEAAHSEASRGDAAALEPADPREVARRVALEAGPGLPWQLAPETLAAYGTQVRGHRLGEAFALTQDPGGAAIVLHTLIVPADLRRAGRGGRLARALMARHAGRAWRIPARVPEDLAPEFCTALGFGEMALSQLEMRLELG